MPTGARACTASTAAASAVQAVSSKSEGSLGFSARGPGGGGRIEGTVRVGRRNTGGIWRARDAPGAWPSAGGDPDRSRGASRGGGADAPLKGLMVSLRPDEEGLAGLRARLPTPAPPPRLAQPSIVARLARRREFFEYPTTPRRLDPRARWRPTRDASGRRHAVRRHAEVRARGEPRRDVCRGRGGRARGSPRSPRSVRRGRWSSRSRTGGRAIVARFDRRDRPFETEMFRSRGDSSIGILARSKGGRSVERRGDRTAVAESSRIRTFRFARRELSRHLRGRSPRARANTPSRDASHATPRAMSRPASAAPKRPASAASSEEANVKVILRCRCVPPTTQRTPPTSRRFREDDVDDVAGG